MYAMATTRIPTAARWIGIGGLLPFAAAAVGHWGAMPAVAPEQALFAGLAYGAVILSFLGGIRWGAAVMAPAGLRRRTWEFAGSVLPAMAGWLSLLLPPLPALSLLISAFLLQALWDVTSVEDGRLPQWFGMLRMLLTSGAVVSLIAMVLRLVA